MTTPQTAHAQLRITRLATALPIHRAFHWLHLYQAQLRQWQLEFLAIPAPPFAEQARAAWFLSRFEALGLANLHLDAAGNALAELPGAPSQSVSSIEVGLNQSDHTPKYILISAHLDTVFRPGTPTTPTEDGSRILGPGSCDNGAGLTALLAIAAALRFANIAPPIPILFAANVGEEGEGDLRGMRHLFSTGPYAGKIAAALALEGSGTAIAVASGLGSRRFKLTISGPGGHSWADAGLPNPITLLSRAIAEIADLTILGDQPGCETTTFNPGVISGGTSVNSIPESASVLLDFRSTEQIALEIVAEQLSEILANLVHPPARFTLEPIGNRPAASLPYDSPLLHTLRAVDRHLGLRTELRLGSTDANIPLALGIPAAALSAGGTGGGIHTLAEWYDPNGRETALRRILLTLLDLAQNLLP
jgi:acetylornithine deacetylase/succinyl-diaminopimelate desuccinylase-like protein